MENTENDGQSKDVGEKIKSFKVWTLAGELGYMIAIPIVLLALAGRLADKQFGTAPWLMLLGIIVSVFLSSAIIYKKIKKIL